MYKESMAYSYDFYHLPFIAELFVKLGTKKTNE